MYGTSFNRGMTTKNVFQNDYLFGFRVFDQLPPSSSTKTVRTFPFRNRILLTCVSCKPFQIEVEVCGSLYEEEIVFVYLRWIWNLKIKIIKKLKTILPPKQPTIMGITGSFPKCHKKHRHWLVKGSKSQTRSLKAANSSGQLYFLGGVVGGGYA